MAQVLVADLPGTLAAWQGGTIDTRKARAITETSYVLPHEQRAALEDRVLPRAGEQTLSRLRAALARAVLALEPDATATVLDHDDCTHPDGPEGCDCTPTEHAPTTSADPADSHSPERDRSGRGEHDCPTTRGSGAGPGKPRRSTPQVIITKPSVVTTRTTIRLRTGVYGLVKAAIRLRIVVQA